MASSAQAERDRIRRSAWGLALAWAIASCSDSGEVHGATPVLSNGSRAATPALSSGEFFAGRAEPPPAGHVEFVARTRPEADGFPVEAAALAVEARLEELLARALRTPSQIDRAASELAGPSFAGSTELVPAELDTVRSDAWISVRRAQRLPTDVDANVGLADRLRAWLGPVAGSEPLSEARVEVRVERAEPGEKIAGSSTESFAMELAIRVFAARQGARVQHNVRWNARFTRASPPRLVDARLAAFEEIRVHAPPLTDATRAEFGALPFFVEELHRGADELIGRRDRLGGESMLAMHGIAVGDVDGDGVEDVFVPQPAGVPNRLLLHKADGRVEDVSSAALVDWLDPCSVAILLDLDGDGHRDLAVCSGSALILAWNDGACRFRTREVIPSPDSAQITALAAADADGDGDLDLYAGRYAQGGMDSSTPVPYHDARNGAANVYWRNEGARKFRIATAEVGLDAGNSRFTQAVLWDDLDDDGDPDLYVVNDFGLNNYYRNDAGRFTDVTAAVKLAHPAAGMGASASDVDLDGDIDLYVSNMDSPAGQRIVRSPRFMSEHRELEGAYASHARGNTLFLNRGDGTFEDATSSAGVAPGGWTWGAVFFDLDNDGFEDLYVPNGFVTGAREDDLESSFWRQVIGRSPPVSAQRPEYLAAWSSLRHMVAWGGFSWNGHERNYVYLNLGGARFADVSSASGADCAGDARGCTVIDWNDDGRSDLLVRNRTRPRLSLWLNTHPSAGRFLALDLVGPPKNIDAIGARVWVEAGGKKLQQSVVAAEGFQTSPSRRLVFGVGDAKSIDRVRVRWPDGSTQECGPLAVDARFRWKEGEAQPALLPARQRSAPAASPESTDLAGLGPLSRIVLSDRLPLRALELDRFDHTRFSIGSLAGRALVVCLWTPGDEASVRTIEALASKARDLQAKGIEIATIVRADAAGIEAARARLRTLGLDARSGPASKRVLLALEIALVEVLGAHEKLPMPLVFLLDRGGSLVALHTGQADFQTLLADVARVAELNPTARSTERISGGRWLYQPRRDLPAVADVFDRLGAAPLATFYREIAATRD